MARWYHRLDANEFEQTPGDGDGQGGLACCDSWGCKESDMTERLNWNELNQGKEGREGKKEFCHELQALESLNIEVREVVMPISHFINKGTEILRHWRTSLSHQVHEQHKQDLNWMTWRVSSLPFQEELMSFSPFSSRFSSVQFSSSFVSDSLQPHESQHSRPPCPSPTPGVYPNSCPSSQ